MRDQDKDNARRTGEAIRAAAVLSGAGLTLAASVGIGALVGNWLDHRLGTAPWLLIVGFFLGTVAGFMELLHVVNAAAKK